MHEINHMILFFENNCMQLQACVYGNIYTHIHAVDIKH